MHSLQPSILGMTISATQKCQKGHLKFEEMSSISVDSLDSLNSLSQHLMWLTGSPSQCLATSLFKGVKACQSRLKTKPGEIPQPQGLSVNLMSPGPFKDHFFLFTVLNSSGLKLQPSVGSRFCFHVMTPCPNS